MDTLTYREIEVSIADYFGIRSHIIVPNYYITLGTTSDHECDLIVVKRSGYAFEVEIKMSRSDLIADFKKKHNHVDERLQCLYYAIPAQILETCKGLVPESAGVIVIKKLTNGDLKASICRVAKNRKCRKLTTHEQLKIARSGTMRVWNLKKEINTRNV